SGDSVGVRTSCAGERFPNLALIDCRTVVARSLAPLIPLEDLVARRQLGLLDVLLRQLLNVLQPLPKLLVLGAIIGLARPQLLEVLDQLLLAGAELRRIGIDFL